MYFMLLFLVLPLSFFAQSQQLDEDLGFLGYRLEAPPDSMPGHLHALGKAHKLNKFRPEPDSVWYDKIWLSSVRLFFFQNQLHSIVIKTEKDADTERLVAALVKRYGPGKPEDQFEGILTWNGKRVYLRYEKNYISGEGVFSFYSHKVHRAWEIAEYNREYGE